MLYKSIIFLAVSLSCFHLFLFTFVLFYYSCQKFNHSNMQLSKTPLSVRKERELEELKKRLKKTRTQLKRNTTILKNLQRDIKDLQKDVANEMMNMQEKMTILQEELKELLKKVVKSRKVDKDSKEQAREFLRDLEDMDEPDSEEFFDEESEHSGGGPSFFFNQFKVEPPKEEQRNIRKTFIKLAAKFHPDKAKTPKEAENFHKIMQQINEAYQRNDILTLLDMEKKYADYETGEISPDLDETAIVSLLDQEIEKAKNELSLLDGQLSRVKGEVRELRASELGSMQKESKRLKKYGVDFVESMREEMDQSIRQLTAVRDVMKELLKKGTLTNEMLVKAGLIPDMSMFFDTFGYDDEDEDYDEDEEDDEMDFEDVIRNLFGL